jgi:O-antigen/teichoic acid export membrane protein
MQMFASFKSDFLDKEIFSKGLISLVLKILGSFFGYVFLWMVTRTLGASAWGEYVIFLAILNILSIFSRLGIDKLVLKLVAASNKNISAIKSIYILSLKLILIISVSISGIIFLLSESFAYLIFDNSSVTIIVKLSVLILPLFSVICLNENTLRGLKMIKEFAFFQRTAKMLFSVGFFIIYFYFINYSLPILVVYSYLSALIIIFILSSLRVYNLLKNVDCDSSININYKKMLKQSLPMMLSSSILLLMAWTDSLMIGSFMGEYQVGIYNVAVKVALFTTLTISAVNSIVAPKISESFNNGKSREFKEIIYYSTRLIFYSTLPVLLFIFIFPEVILSFFGKEFIVAKMTLLILTMSQAINALSGSVGTILNMTGKQKVYGNILLIALLINVTLNYLLIPIYGINGAAIASASSLIFWNLYSVIYIYRKYHVMTMITCKIK